MSATNSNEAMRRAFAETGLTPVFLWLPANALLSPSYQRPLRLSWAKTIARELDPDKFWPLLVSRRDDGDYVLDGQHRLYAVRDLLHWDDQNVPCEVYSGLSLAMEAKLYATQAATGRKPLTPVERLYAELTAGDPEAVTLAATVERAGLAIDWSAGKGEGTIRAMTTISAMHHAHGPDHTFAVLTLLRDTLGLDARVYQKDVLVGMSQFLLRYHADRHYQRSEFVRKIGRAGLDALLQRARQIAAGYTASITGRGGIAVGPAMLVLYNLDRRTLRLPDWQERTPMPSEVEERRNQRLSDTRRRQYASGALPLTGAVLRRVQLATQAADHAAG